MKTTQRNVYKSRSIQTVQTVRGISGVTAASSNVSHVAIRCSTSMSVIVLFQIHLSIVTTDVGLQHRPLLNRPLR